MSLESSVESRRSGVEVDCPRPWGHKSTRRLDSTHLESCPHGRVESSTHCRASLPQSSNQFVQKPEGELIYWFHLPLAARVAKLADARDLKPQAPKGA